MGGKVTKDSVPKCLNTGQQRKVALDSSLKVNKEKKNRRRLVKSRSINEEDLSPVEVVEVDNEETVKEPTPFVRKNSKKTIIAKQKKIVSKKEHVSDKDNEVEEEEEVEKEKVENKKPLKKRQSTSEEPGSSKKPTAELSELERRANLKKQKVLWA
ncbi:uncharacterized protein [Nicotiana sylvestris]|uniref:uncharacterized protein n=1 Tax=Nicotiana sylvestris TaxID=4096 RepID=UPI00388CD0C6